MAVIRVIALLMLTLMVGRSRAEPDAATLAHTLDRVATTGRVLYVAAHPDDENTRLLAYLANVKHFEAAYLSITRGGGGQNLIGGEQGVLLDVIRTEELLSARRLDGARQFFTRMRDFGYSKREDETLSLWDRKEALSDVVRVIRTFQPDVIITRFSEKPPNHGHHTASAILAREAFTAAADPKQFPEHKLPPWQARRIVHNVPSWPGAPPPPASAIELDVGAYDPRFGLGMGELAARSRSQHKSQGFGVAEARGPIIERFLFVAGAKVLTDLFEGVDTRWTRYGAAATAYTSAITEAQRLLERDRPARAVPALVRAHQALDKLRDDVRVREARAAIAELIAGAAGLYIRPNAATPVAAVGTSIAVALEIATRGTPVTIDRIELANAPRAGPKLAAVEQKLIKIDVPLANRAPSLAYWLAQPPRPGHYVVGDPGLIGAPAPAALTVALDVTIGGRKLRLIRPVIHAWTDRVHGEQERPFTIVPSATATPLREAVLATGPAASKQATSLDIRVRAGRDAVTGTLELALPAGWSATPKSHPLALAKQGDEVTLRFAVRAAEKAAAGEATPIVRIAGETWSLREDVIAYPHIPMQLVLRPASVRLTPLAIALPAGRVGYVAGSGDTIAEDLAHVGLQIEQLDDEALRTRDLSSYAAIVLGIRAHNTRAVLRAVHARLLAYVERGGTLVVQYTTRDYTAPLGPFPFELSRDRITDETAAPTFLAPAHPLLARPNKITAADFAGWIQERGIYFGAKWDTRYTPLLRFSDPHEQPLDGALLVAQHGKGRYIYTGLALFRQLPAGVPGAYRLFANLIAGGK